MEWSLTCCRKSECTWHLLTIVLLGFQVITGDLMDVIVELEGPPTGVNQLRVKHFEVGEVPMFHVAVQVTANDARGYCVPR